MRSDHRGLRLMRGSARQSGLPSLCGRRVGGLIAGLLLVHAATAQSKAAEIGVPLLQNTAPRDYGADAQNWAIVQDSRGLIYVANTLGVLEYDGRRWTQYKLNNQSTVRSLAVDPQDVIYVGGSDEFGMLTLDAFGQRHYQALHNRLPAGLRPVGEVRATHVTAEGVIYDGLRQLIRVNGEQVQSWTPNSSFHFSFQLGDRLLVWEQGRGMLELQGVELRPLPGAEALADLRVYAAMPLDTPAGGEATLLATRRNGLFLSDADGIRAWPTEIDEALKRDLIYRGVRLHSGDYALGTLRGLYLIDAQGHLLLHLTRQQGLRDDDILSLFEDRAGTLWLGLDNGLSRIELNSPISRFAESQGLSGRVIALKRHQQSLYAATGRGLFVLRPGQPASFDPVQGISDQTWALLSLDQQLMVGNSNGLFSVTGTQAQLALTTPTAVAALHTLADQPNRLLLGLDGGFELAERHGSDWTHQALLPGFDELVQAIEQPQPDRLWLGVHPHGVAELSITTDSNGAVKTGLQRWYREADGVPAQTQQRLQHWRGQWRLLGTDTARWFDPDTDSFVSDPSLQPWSERHDVVLDLLAAASNTEHWFHAHRRSDGMPVSGRFEIDASGQLQSPSFEPSLQGITTRTLLSESDGVTWIGSDEGLFRYRRNGANTSASPFPLLIRSLRAGEAALPIQAEPNAPPALAFEQRTLHLQVALPGAANSDDYRLEARIPGVWDGWRALPREQSLDIENLDEGNHSLQLRAVDPRGHLLSELSYPFSILPPWYRSSAFLLSCALGVALLIVALVHWRTRSLRQQNLALERKVAERTTEIERSRQQLGETLDQLRNTQAQLVERERLASLGSLVAGVAHELNTPLGYTLTVTSHLQTQLEETERTFTNGQLTRSQMKEFLHLTAEALRISVRGLQRGAILIQRFKQLAIGHQRETPKTFSLRTLLNSVVADLQPELDTNGISLRIECPLDLSVESSEDALYQVLRQLLENAVQHAFPNGRHGLITLRALVSEDGRLRITVSDDGVGMESNVLSSALEPFYTTRRHQGGVGLGLSTAHNQVLGQLGGALQLHSVRDQGTRVELILPMRPQHGSEHPI